MICPMFPNPAMGCQTNLPLVCLPGESNIHQHLATGAYQCQPGLLYLPQTCAPSPCGKAPLVFVTSPTDVQTGIPPSKPIPYNIAAQESATLRNKVPTNDVGIGVTIGQSRPISASKRGRPVSPMAAAPLLQKVSNRQDSSRPISAGALKPSGQDIVSAPYRTLGVSVPSEQKSRPYPQQFDPKSASTPQSVPSRDFSKPKSARSQASRASAGGANKQKTNMEEKPHFTNLMSKSLSGLRSDLQNSDGRADQVMQNMGIRFVDLPPESQVLLIHVLAYQDARRRLFQQYLREKANDQNTIAVFGQ